MQRVTGALELLGVLLVLAALGWWVADVAGVPVGLCSVAVGLWVVSWLLQGAPVPQVRRRAGRAGGERR